MDQWARLISYRGSCPPMESVSSEQGPVCALSSWAKLCSFSLLGASFTEADTGSLPLFQLWELQSKAPGHLSPANTRRCISLCKWLLSPPSPCCACGQCGHPVPAHGTPAAGRQQHLPLQSKPLASSPGFSGGFGIQRGFVLSCALTCVYLLCVATVAATTVGKSLQPFQRAHFLVMLPQSLCWYP